MKMANGLKVRIVSLLASTVLSVFLPAAMADGIQPDIEYAKIGDESVLLDVSVPEGAGPFPVAIIVHGGGWSSGDKQEDITVLFEPLTRAKFTWFSINYRLSPKYRWPACLEDVQTAIRWVRAHAAEFKGDPNRIALIGYSAGGQLTCMAAVLAKEDSRVQAVVGFAPPVDLVLDALRRGGPSTYMKDLFGRQTLDDEMLQILWDASPINHLKTGLPPFLLIHGTADKSVPYQQSLNFQTRLKALGGQCDLTTVEGAPHRITDWDKFDASYKEKMINWLTQTLGGRKQSGTDSQAEKNIRAAAVLRVCE
jgi:acetyl esterase/lipase